MNFPSAFICWCAVVGTLWLAGPANADDQPPAAPLHLDARARQALPGKAGEFEVIDKKLDWEPSKTALILCDVWDTHTCRGAAARVNEMAPRIDAFAKALRSRGVFIVHAPSDTMKFYEGTPARKLAQEAPPATPPAPMNAWQKIVPAVEPPLPIDDSDGGCDDDPPCDRDVHGHWPWTREHPAITVADGDAVSDKGAEIYNLFHQRGIRHVILAGVHCNMCVLGRSFGIRRLTAAGFDVALCRDLTDTMYNSRMAPFVPHARGTDLVVEHVEKYWCPSFLSSQILGDPKPTRIVFAIDEEEYHAKETLPAFGKAELEGKESGAGGKIECVYLQSDQKTELPGTEALDKADLLVIFMRRTTLPAEQLARFKAYFEAGKPVVVVRTGCHAFQNYLEFDQQVLGCHYNLHWGNAAGTAVGPAGAEGSPLLRGVSPPEFHSAGSLYKVNPLAESAKPLLVGKFQDKPAEPVAWTTSHRGGRVFVTTLGHPEDFKLPQFRRLLTNGVRWALDEPVKGNDGRKDEG